MRCSSLRHPRTTGQGEGGGKGGSFLRREEGEKEQTKILHKLVAETVGGNFKGAEVREGQGTFPGTLSTWVIGLITSPNHEKNAS